MSSKSDAGSAHRVFVGGISWKVQHLQQRFTTDRHSWVGRWAKLSKLLLLVWEGNWMQDYHGQSHWKIKGVCRSILKSCLLLLCVHVATASGAHSDPAFTVVAVRSERSPLDTWWYNWSTSFPPFVASIHLRTSGSTSRIGPPHISTAMRTMSSTDVFA